MVPAAYSLGFLGRFPLKSPPKSISWDKPSFGDIEPGSPKLKLVVSFSSLVIFL